MMRLKTPLLSNNVYDKAVGFMAGSSVTITEERFFDNQRIEYAKITFAWVSDDTTQAATGTTTKKYTGQLIQFTDIPSAGGTAPTDQYDIVLLDDQLVDLLGSAGSNRSGTLTGIKTAISAGQMLGFAVDTTLNFTLANAGLLKQGTFTVLIRLSNNQ